MRKFLSQSLALTVTSASFNGKDDLNSPTLSIESICTADLTIEVTEIAIAYLHSKQQLKKLQILQTLFQKTFLAVLHLLFIFKKKIKKLITIALMTVILGHI